MSGAPSVAEWIERRSPRVPVGFRGWIAPREPSAPASVEALVREAKLALVRVENPEGRPRGGAFDLLAADGYATWACEAALDDVDPARALRLIVDALLE